MKGLFGIVALVAIGFACFSAGQGSIELLNDQCPDGRCPRTIPFNATTAPVFEVPPAVGVSPVVDFNAPVVVAPAVPQVVVAPSTNGVQITDEQKEALKSTFISLATLLLGLFAGRGTTSPIVTKVIATVLEYLKNRQPAEPKAPASTRRRAARRK